jgi:hypothetical protein
VNGTWREDTFAGDLEGYLEKVLETGIPFYRGSFAETGGGLVYREI